MLRQIKNPGDLMSLSLKYLRSTRSTMALFLVLTFTVSLAACEAAEQFSPTAPQSVAEQSTAPERDGSRRRPVHLEYDQSAVLSGTVLDSSDSSPVFGAEIMVGSRKTVAAANGSFTLDKLPKGQQSVLIERWGYQPVTRSVTLNSGPNTLNVTLVSKPVVLVTDASGAVHRFDEESTQFATAGPFSSYSLLSPAEFCKGDGNLVHYDKSEIRTIIGPGTDVSNSPCCPQGGTAVKVQVVLKTGETFEALIRECVYYRYDLIGRNRATGQFEYFGFRNIVRAEFP
ncbi:MAG: carboxypeptidase regulatory-like domain-containing protein [Acidobacteriota bacterium]